MFEVQISARELYISFIFQHEYTIFDTTVLFHKISKYLLGSVTYMILFRNKFSVLGPDIKYVLRTALLSREVLPAIETSHRPRK